MIVTISWNCNYIRNLYFISQYVTHSLTVWLFQQYDYISKSEFISLTFEFVFHNMTVFVSCNFIFHNWDLYFSQCDFCTTFTEYCSDIDSHKIVHSYINRCKMNINYIQRFIIVIKNMFVFCITGILHFCKKYLTFVLLIFWLILHIHLKYSPVISCQISAATAHMACTNIK